jgi:hypothetical protein
MTPSTLSLPEQFLHVVYEYRYFALAGLAWKQFGKDGSHEAEANALLPGIGVLVQDSLLMHARLLIDFYTKTYDSRYPHDILLENFCLPAVGETLRDSFRVYKEPIEVHVLHLSMWRDADYRLGNGRCQRPDWDKHNPIIIDLLFKALEKVSEPMTPSSSEEEKATTSWRTPFRYLHSSAKAILDNASGDFPPELLEKDDVIAYLKTLGLS